MLFNSLKVESFLDALINNGYRNALLIVSRVLSEMYMKTPRGKTQKKDFFLYKNRTMAL